MGEPEKIYWKIGEAAELLELPQYVLRYWETEFPELRPRKTGSGRRIYGRADLELLRKLKRLLHEERYTIAGARQVLEAERSSAVGGGGAPPTAVAAVAAAAVAPPQLVERLREMRRELAAIRELLTEPRGAR